jgi:phosphoglycolate phosphatase
LNEQLDSMKYKLVIFDFDGTLADSFSWLMGAMGPVADRYRFKRVPAEKLHELRGMGADQILSFLDIAWWKVPFIARHVRSLMSRDTAEIHLFPGVETLLANLVENGLRIAIVSSNTEENIRSILGASNAEHITWYEGNTSLFGKARRLRKVLRRSGFAPADAIYVGDEVRDVLAAKKSGISSGAVAWGYARADALEARRPTMMFQNIESILTALTGEASKASKDG